MSDLLDVTKSTKGRVITGRIYASLTPKATFFPLNLYPFIQANLLLCQLFLFLILQPNFYSDTSLFPIHEIIISHQYLIILTPSLNKCSISDMYPGFAWLLSFFLHTVIPQHPLVQTIVRGTVTSQSKAGCICTEHGQVFFFIIIT